MGRLLPARVMRISSLGPGRSKGAVAEKAIGGANSSIVIAGSAARNHDREFIPPILWNEGPSFDFGTELGIKNFNRKGLDSEMMAEASTTARSS